MSACPEQAHVRSRQAFTAYGTIRTGGSRRNSGPATWTKAVVTISRILIVFVLALRGLLSVPVAGAAEPCAGHGAAATVVSAQSAADIGLALEEAALAADDSNPCPHCDQQPCKQSCGACVAAVATLVRAPASPPSPVWILQPAELAPPVTGPTRLDRPPRG